MPADARLKYFKSRSYGFTDRDDVSYYVFRTEFSAIIPRGNNLINRDRAVFKWEFDDLMARYKFAVPKRYQPVWDENTYFSMRKDSFCELYTVYNHKSRRLIVLERICYD